MILGKGTVGYVRTYAAIYIYIHWWGCLSSFRKKLEWYTGLVLLVLGASHFFYILLLGAGRAELGLAVCIACSCWYHLFRTKLCSCSSYLVMQEKEKVAYLLLLVSLFRSPSKNYSYAVKFTPGSAGYNMVKINLSVSTRLKSVFKLLYCVVWDFFPFSVWLHW